MRTVSYRNWTLTIDTTGYTIAKNWLNGIVLDFLTACDAREYIDGWR